MTDVTNERLVLTSLVKNEEYLRKFLPHIKPEYFEDLSEQRLFKLIAEYAGKYNEPPDQSTLQVAARNDQSLSEKQGDDLLSVIKDVASITPTKNMEFLKKTTQDWVQMRAVYNALQKGIAVYQGEDSSITIAAVPDILAQAISVSFDAQIGQNYFDDAALRYEFYTNPESRIQFRMDPFNEATCGGVTRKTLNLLVAGTNVGKSLGLCSLAADYIRDGYNVLYISFEMREELVMQRVDANILNVPANALRDIPKEKFIDRVEAIRAKSYGQLVVKEFPPSSASVLNVRQVIDELKMKKSFLPDVIIVDYLQIMASYRLPYSVGSYYYFKSVAEELRALAVETNTTIWSAAQFNRGQMSSTEVSMDGIAESAGIAHTADGMWALVRTEELDQQNQLMVVQLKSRYANKAVKPRFVIGVDIDRQMLYGVDDDRSDRLTQPGGGGHQILSGSDLKNKFLGLNTD